MKYILIAIVLIAALLAAYVNIRRQLGKGAVEIDERDLDYDLSEIDQMVKIQRYGNFLRKE